MASASAPDHVPSALHISDGVRRPLFAQVPDVLLKFVEDEMTERRPDGQPPVQKNVIVQEMLFFYRDMRHMAMAREDGAPLSPEEQARIVGWLSTLKSPILQRRPKRNGKEAK